MKSFKEYLNEQRLLNKIVSAGMSGLMALGSPAVTKGETTGRQSSSSSTTSGAGYNTNINRNFSDTTKTGNVSILGTGIQHRMIPVRSVVSGKTITHNSASGNANYSSSKQTTTVGNKPPVTFETKSKSGKFGTPIRTPENIVVSTSSSDSMNRGKGFGTPFTNINLSGISQTALNTSTIPRLRRRI